MSVLASPLAGVGRVPRRRARPADASAGRDGPDADGDGRQRLGCDRGRCDARIAATRRCRGGSPDDAGLDGVRPALSIDGASLEGTFDGCARLPARSRAASRRRRSAKGASSISRHAKGRAIDAGYFLYCQLASVSCDDAGDVLDAATIIECVSCQRDHRAPPARALRPAEARRSAPRSGTTSRRWRTSSRRRCAPFAISRAGSARLDAPARLARAARGARRATSAATRAPRRGSRVASEACPRARAFGGSRRPRSSRSWKTTRLKGA